MSIQLTGAIVLARHIHRHQKDKAGNPYADHCLRVLEVVRAELPQDIDAQCAAVLHDVIEDSGVGPVDLLRAGMSDRTVGLVKQVSRNWALSYLDWIEWIARHADPVAKRIKLADLRDNGSPARLELIPIEATRERLRTKYDEALLVMIEHM